MNRQSIPASLAIVALRRQRILADIQQCDVADFLGLHQSDLSRLERGRPPRPTAWIPRAVAAYLACESTPEIREALEALGPLDRIRVALRRRLYPNGLRGPTPFTLSDDDRAQALRLCFSDGAMTIAALYDAVRLAGHGFGRISGHGEFFPGPEFTGEPIPP